MLHSGFWAPSTTRDVLDFLFDSQNRFRSYAHLKSHFSMLDLPSPELLPTEALSPSTPNLSLDNSMTARLLSPLQLLTPMSPSPASTKSHSETRFPLGVKSVNSQQASTKSRDHREEQNDGTLSPFTALPPKLGMRVRGVRSMVATAVTAPARKSVDTTFLGTDAVTQRRKKQFDAARRKLEGVGYAAEQRSDSDSEYTGVLEAKGEASTRRFSR